MLWIVISLAVALSLASLRGEAAREAYYRWSLGQQGPTPLATVIVPVKGMDEGLAGNLASLASLDYPDYELIVVARAAEDLPVACVPARARVVLAGEGEAGTGEKINNLMAAVRAVRPETEVLAFADSDGRVSAGWLRALTATLSEEGVGAATGYRWHLPADAVNSWSLLRSVWNAVIAGGMGPGNNRFAWGGATAIRVKTFWELNVPGWWRGAISDDYRLSEAVRASGKRIGFAPGALVASTDHTGGLELMGWIRRQMMITRFYAPTLWRVALVAHMIYCVGMAGASWLAFNGSFVAAGAVIIQIGVGCWKGYRRLRLAEMAMVDHRNWFRRFRWLHVALVPVGTWLWLYGCVASALSRVMIWRGYRIELRRLPKLG